MDTALDVKKLDDTATAGPMSMSQVDQLEGQIDRLYDRWYNGPSKPHPNVLPPSMGADS